MTLLGYKLVCFSKNFNEQQFEDCFPEVAFRVRSIGARAPVKKRYSPIYKCEYPVSEIEFAGEFLIESLEQIYADSSAVVNIPYEFLAQERKMHLYLDRYKCIVDGFARFCETRITNSFVVYLDTGGGRSNFGFECTSQLTSKMKDLDCGLDLRFIALESYFCKLRSGDLWRL